MTKDKLSLSCCAITLALLYGSLQVSNATPFLTVSVDAMHQLPAYQQPPAELSFTANSATLENYLYGAVGRIADTLAAYPQLHVILVGFADASDHSGNRTLLAQRRAVHIADVLVHDFGVDEGRISVRSAVQSQNAAQRRVEVLFTQPHIPPPEPPEGF